MEIDYLQNALLHALLPAQELKYNNVWGVDFSVKVMDIKEITAEKIRAMSDRARYRDFYDLFLILEKYQLNLDKIVGYIKQKKFASQSPNQVLKITGQLSARKKKPK